MPTMELKVVVHPFSLRNRVNFGCGQISCLFLSAFLSVHTALRRVLQVVQCNTMLVD